MRHPALVFLLFVLVLAAVYAPAMDGELVWDDADHVTKKELRAVDGLVRIWTDPRAAMQYYPVTHSLFWIEHRLWGDRTFGYHLVNVLLHAAGATLVWRILRRLAVPGAPLAAAIFALHPVQVESVAWITEHKNTLSGVFYLGALLAYLRPARSRAWYALALVLFAAALLAKSVAATLPAAVLVLLWWKRGTLSLRRDVVPLVPFFALGAVMGLLTLWLETHHIGASGSSFDLSWPERCIVAGRAFWFYLGKLVFPVNLTFIYPRWSIDGSSPQAYLAPAAAIAMGVVLLVLRGRIGRGPLAALLYFVVTLSPALGFFDVFPFKYSFVSDHFQYLACLGPIALGAGLIDLALARAPSRAMAAGVPALLLGALAIASFRQSRQFEDAPTLWRTTIARNPACWMAYTNLGVDSARRGDREQAIELYRKALAIDPTLAEPHFNIANSLVALNRDEEAIEHYRHALGLMPDYAEAHYNLGVVLTKTGDAEGALQHLRRSVEIRPDFVRAHVKLAQALAAGGDADGAIEEYRRALALAPADPEANNSLGATLARKGRLAEAIEHFRRSIATNASFAEAHNNLGQALGMTGKRDEAIAEFREAVRLKPDYARARENLDRALAARPMN